MSTGYPNLREKVKAFLLSQGGAVAEDALIAHVFGSAGSPTLWRPLLKQLLVTDETPGFRQLANGAWQLATQPQPHAPGQSLAALDYVVLDVETTGLKPYSQRMIEIAAIRFRGGQEDAAFCTLLQPDRALPAQIVSLTRITDDLLVDAPRFAEIAPALLEFLGNDMIVGHNVSFDLAFLDAELRRASHSATLNPRLDTLPLAQRVLGRQRRWNLDAVARAVGIQLPTKRHRAEVDARITASVLTLLLQRAPESGLHSLDDLLRIGGARGSSFAGDGTQTAHGRGRAVLNTAWLNEIPHQPGCYLMRDEHDDVIYVGKAKDLRNRVGSYYSQALGETNKPGLLEAIKRIETIIVGSELEALLLESQLIRRYTPRYNVQGRRYEQYPYIKVDLADSWPRVWRTRRRLDDGAAYFGPFRNPRAVQRALEIVQDILPLRTCRPRITNPHKQWPSCLRLTLGQCVGPCVGQTTQEEYGALVDDLLRFLAGDVQVMIDRAQARRLSVQQRGRYSVEGEALAAAQRHLAAVAHEGALLTTAAATDDLLLVLPAVEPTARELFLLTQGRLWARFHVAASDSAADLAARLRRSWQRAHAAPLLPPDHEAVDEVAILAGWLRRRADELSTFALPANADEADWQALAAASIAADLYQTPWEQSAEAVAEDADEDDTDSLIDDDADELIVLG